MAQSERPAADADREKFRRVGDEAYGVLLGSGNPYYQGVEDAMRYVVAGHLGSRKFAHLLGAIRVKQESGYYAATE